MLKELVYLLLVSFTFTYLLCMRVGMYGGSSDDSLLELFLNFSHMRSGDWIQAVSLGSKCLYLCAVSSAYFSFCSDHTPSWHMDLFLLMVRGHSPSKQGRHSCGNGMLNIWLSLQSGSRQCWLSPFHVLFLLSLQTEDRSSICFRVCFFPWLIFFGVIFISKH